MGSNFLNVRNYKIYLLFHKKLRIPRSLVRSTYFIKYQQSIFKYFLFFLKVHSKRIFNLSRILILILKSFVNTGPYVWGSDTSITLQSIIRSTVVKGKFQQNKNRYYTLLIGEITLYNTILNNPFFLVKRKISYIFQ